MTDGEVDALIAKLERLLRELDELYDIEPREPPRPWVNVAVGDYL